MLETHRDFPVPVPAERAKVEAALGSGAPLPSTDSARSCRSAEGEGVVGSIPWTTMRYYIAKFASPSVLSQAKQSGSWSLDGALEGALQGAEGKAVVFLTLNMSGHFQGAAMVTEASQGQASLGWLYTCDLPFADVKHLSLPKKNASEVEPKSGEGLLALVKAKGKAEDLPPSAKRKRAGDGAQAGSRGAGSRGSGGSGPGLDFTLSGHLCDLSYGEYLKFFDTFKAASERVGRIESLFDLSRQEKKDIARAMSLDDFMDVCRVVCEMNGTSFSQRERSLVDFYKAI